MLRVGRLFACCASLGCAAPAGSRPGATADEHPPTTFTTDTASPAPVPTGPDTAETVPPLDCAAIPDEPLSEAVVPGARGFHDVAFDRAGNIYGSDGASLVRATYDGTAGPFAVPDGGVAGLDRLLDGDLVGAASATSSLFRVDVGTGASSLLSGDHGAYGVVVARDGTIWTAEARDGIRRTDPATGETTEIFSGHGILPRVLNFAPDDARLYFGTLSGVEGIIYAIDLDADLDPLGEAYPYARGVGDGQFHDSLAVDGCGNLYVMNFDDGWMWRVVPNGDPDGDGRPNGTAGRYFDPAMYAHGAKFGSGIGGWRVDALYVPHPYDENQVSEIVVGVPGRVGSP
jgi:hypothetical protein